MSCGRIEVDLCQGQLWSGNGTQGADRIPARLPNAMDNWNEDIRWCITGNNHGFNFILNYGSHRADFLVINFI